MMERPVNIADRYPFLADDSTFNAEVNEMVLALKANEAPVQLQQSINAALKENAILILSYLETKSERAKQMSLQGMLDRMVSPANPVRSLISLFDTCAAVLSALKRDLPEFIQIQANFSFDLMFFNSLFKFTKIDIRRCLGTENLRLVWLAFVILAPNLNGSQANTRRLNLLCTLIFKVVYSNETTAEKLEEMNSYFERELHFKLDMAEYNRKAQLIESKLPDFNSPAFDFDKRRQEYIAALGPLDVNLLIFLSSLDVQDTDLTTLTPINRRSMSLNSPQSNLRKMHGKSDKASGNCLLNMDRKTAFEKVVEHYQSPVRQLDQNDHNRTITFGRTESRDHSRELGSSAQWYKDQVKGVVLYAIELGHKETIPCSSFVKSYAENAEVRQRLKEAVSEIKQKSGDDADALAFFFCVLDKLIVAESSRSNETDVQNLIKERNFLQSVICFSLDFGALINRTTKLRFEEVMQMCRCGHLDVWKIIFSFNRAVGRQLPNTLKMRISELETDILLRAIWSESEGQKCLARSVFASSNVYSDLAIKQILRISAERLFIISSKNFDLPLQEKTWELFKRLLFYGMDDETQSAEISFKTNKHIDFLIVGALYHVAQKNSKNEKMKDLIAKYFGAAAFPTALNYSEFQSYYCNTFKKTVKDLLGDDGFRLKVEIKEKQILNDTPIQSHVKKRMDDFVKTPFRNMLSVELGRRAENPEVPALPAFSSDKKLKFSFSFTGLNSPGDFSRHSGPTDSGTPLFGFSFPSPANTPNSVFSFGDSFPNSAAKPLQNRDKEIITDGTGTPKFDADNFK